MMEESNQSMWTLIKDRFNSVLQKNPEKLDKLGESLDPILEDLENTAASEEIEDYEMAARIRNYRRENK